MALPPEPDSAGEALEILPAAGRSHVARRSSSGRVTTPSIEMRELSLEIRLFKIDMNTFLWKMAAINLASMIVISILVMLAVEFG